MKTITLAALALALVLPAAVSPADAAAAPVTSAETTLTVNGDGLVQRAPDQATLGVSLVTNDDVATRALSENNTKYTTLVARVEALGVAAADIKTTSLSTYNNPRPASPIPTLVNRYGYIVSRYVQITINNLETTGRVIDAAVAAGAGNVNGVTYGFRDARAVQRQALAAAVTDAQDQARSIAEAARMRIVRIKEITNQSGPFFPRPLATMGNAVMRGAPAPTPPPVPTDLPPSNLDVRASITITFVLAP